MNALLDEWLADDYANFDRCMADAGEPILEGYWSPFSALAWIASRGDADFLAAVQLFEERNHANRGGHTWPSWLVCGNKSGMLFGQTFTDAAAQMLGKLKAGKIPGCIATNRGDGALVDIERSWWTRYREAHETWGLELIPGLVDFQFPAEGVLGAFPFERDGRADVAQSPRGRRAGVGGYRMEDEALARRMQAMIASNEARSPWDATRLLVDEIPGGGDENSRRKRVAGVYNRLFP